jgi:hypothetical protein
VSIACVNIVRRIRQGGREVDQEGTGTKHRVLDSGRIPQLSLGAVCDA